MRNPVDPAWIVTTTVFLSLTISLSVLANPFQQWFSNAFRESESSITSRPNGTRDATRDLRSTQ
jgi:NADH:ubiquinone oxidoreductase subunit 2 (subunit N)